MIHLETENVSPYFIIDFCFSSFFADDWASDLVWASDPCKTINISFAQSLSAPFRRKKNHRSMCLICILQRIHKSILTKRTFAFLSLIKCDCFVQNWSECTPSLSCGKRALLSAIKRGNWNPMGYCQTGFQYLSILFA